MPKLPTIESSRDTQLLEKGGWDRGAIEQEKKGWVPKFKPKQKNISPHIRLGIAIFVLLLALVGVYSLGSKYLPDLIQNRDQSQDRNTEFGVPVDISKIKFQSEMNKQAFLDEVEKAKTEHERGKRYEHVQRSFVLLNNLYLFEHSADTRVELEKFRNWVKVTFPQKYEANRNLYDFTCLDALCGDLVPPEQVTAFKLNVEELAIDPIVKQAIRTNLETAVAYKEPGQQFNVYINVLASLKSEHEKTQDQAIAQAHSELLEFVRASFADNQIPEQVLI